MASPAIEYLAGLTRLLRPDIHISVIDANKEAFDPGAVDADLVGFPVLTPHAPWVYRMADRLREAGKKVVLGGVHVSALPGEASPHADAIVTGEAEGVWSGLLEDLESGRLRPVYHGNFPELNGLPQPATDLWRTRYVFGYFQTSRGCPNKCNFCSVHKFFGGRVRLRPIGEVVAELNNGSKHLYWGIDDNIWGLNVERSIELYREMARSVKGKWWFGTGDLVTMEHPRAGELLKYARRSGLRAVMLGWEANNPLSLDEYRAVAKQGRSRRDAIRRIRDNGIDVMLFVIVGGRQDTARDFDDMLKLSDDLNVAVHPVLTIPFPGTDIYELYKPYLYPDLTWDLFDGNNAVFEHPTMTRREREDAFTRLRIELFSVPRILKRMPEISMLGFPMSHIMSWMMQYPPGRAFRKFSSERRA